MKKILYFCLLLSMIGSIGLFLFIQSSRSISETLVKECQSYRSGQKIDLNAEIERLKGQGLSASLSLAEDKDNDTKTLIVLTPGMEPEICTINTQNGIVVSVH